MPQDNTSPETGRTVGRLISATGGLFTVLTRDGDVLNLRARGNLRRLYGRLLVGDTVTLDRGDGNGDASAVITGIVERRSALIRPPLANLDVCFTVIAAALPAPDLPTADKLLTILAYNHIEAVPVITKADLDPDSARNLFDIYTRAGYSPVTVSVRDGRGLDTLARRVSDLPPGCVMAFAGASGVGKSSLLNALYPGIDSEIGEISRKIGRGKNTTRVTRLYPVSDGRLIADTAGFSLLDFENFDFFPFEALPDTFPEFAPYIGTCRYTDCSHTKESSADCSVVRAVSEGVIPKSRHDTYVSLYAILKEKKPWK